MPVPYRALALLADFEPATIIGSIGLKHAIDYLRNAGFTVNVLDGADDIRVNVIEDLTRNDEILVFGVGHGSKTVYTGYNFDKIFWTCDCGELRGRVVYTLSCLCGAELGPDIIGKGGWCYIGYSKVFGWIQEKYGDPLADRYARGFYEAVLEILYSLADGLTTGEAYKRSIDKWNYWIDYWSRQDDPRAPLILSFLIHDRDCQVLLGDENARISIPAYLSYLAPASIPLLVVGGVIAYNEVSKSWARG